MDLDAFTAVREPQWQRLEQLLRRRRLTAVEADELVVLYQRAATDLSVLRSKRYEQIILQACHPRFFASHRWITYGRLTKVDPPGGDAASEARN